jgi:phospholipase C
MIHTRRDFLRNAAMLSGTAFVWGSVPEAIARAMEIDPAHGSTFLDAEHVVILMQENRSFDHSYGALRGVRGFRDPRPHVQPNGNPVWFQTDRHEKTYAPFRLDIKNTKVTWIGGLPHSWHDQLDARNGGRYDKWLIAKPKEELPFTLGHYTRQDIPFYYALADAFTVCDQAFCSSLTGTTPNRLFLWTGNIRKDASDHARTLNSDTDYGVEANWPTFPERLEDAGVSWRVYQNEISLESGFQGEQDDWLSNFTDNPLEWFTQYNVRFAKSHRDYIERTITQLTREISTKESGAGQAASDTEIDEAKAKLKAAEAERETWNEANWNSLAERSKALHQKAFAVNDGDPNHRELTSLKYQDGPIERELQVPMGDTLHRFRDDVDGGNLPQVSWIVAPSNFSDHPGSAWYGAWYVSEVLAILTKNPDVWKKTVFILCYDENDGYFDHVPPFMAPFPGRPETGRVSDGIDTSIDVANVHGRENSIGLGFRVPLVVASPWSRGGGVNSQVFDHTSIIQFMEVWLAGKGKPVHESNVSDWRRTVCGDLTSVFRPFVGAPIPALQPLTKDEVIEGIHAAKFKEMPKGGKALSSEEILQADVKSNQEPGTRPACPLPYELSVNAIHGPNGLELLFTADNKAFGKRAQGAPFNVYSYGKEMSARSYAVRAGDELSDVWPIDDAYHIRVDGPNGFMRSFKGQGSDSTLSVEVEAKARGTKLAVRIQNRSTAGRTVEIKDESYGSPRIEKAVSGMSSVSVTVDTRRNRGWYDFTVKSGDLEYRYAGRLETGSWSISDPAMA